MFIKIDGVEPQFKVYKMSECIEGKIYIGKTKRPIRDRMNNHRSSQQYADKHFSNVGWNNVVVEIIDTANDENELNRKEFIKINEYYKNHKSSLLNRNNYDAYTSFKSQLNKEEGEYIYFNEIDIFPSNHWFYCQRKVDEHPCDVFRFIKLNKYIIKNVNGARRYISQCIRRMKRNELNNDEVKAIIINFLKNKPWRGKCETNKQWDKK